ncbi:MAG: hypothetical protein JRS35_02730 [Deltaproteobacteria bacterium]|nr:hypothetical protein [Deltaproteobacteria bacterium]
MSRAVWIVAFAAGLLAGPAWGSKVVEVRIGNHPTFTRVVFELDAPAGYGIERRTVEEGASEILVTLEASSTPRSVMSRSAMVERVAVQDGRARSVAHIRLKKSPSRVKELILSNPPRIVFDLMLPEKELLAVARKAQAEAALKADKKEKTEAAETQKLATAPKPAPEALAALKALKPTPEASVAPKAPKPTPEASAAPKAPEPKAELTSTPKPSPPRAAEPKPSAASKAPPPAELPKQVAPPEPEKPKALAKAEPPKPAVRPLPPRAEPKKAAAKKPASAPVPTAGGGIDWVTWGGMAAGVLVVLLAIVLVLRRRALPNDLDVTALAEEESNEGGILDGGFAMGEEAAPMSMGATAEASEPAPKEPIAPGTQIPEEEPPRSTPDIAAGPGLFDDEPEKENETMDTESTDMPMERTASELPTQMGAGVAGAAGESDIARLVQDLERRVAQLETRLDESVDARERLERQVAAQSEELRVQRAAIARTQRALRSLNRGEEEQATEPALRESSA